jgi:hypothetical protein
MTMAYPFPVSGDEFKGKRVLVTGGTKGMGQAFVVTNPTDESNSSPLAVIRKQFRLQGE